MEFYSIHKTTAKRRIRYALSRARGIEVETDLRSYLDVVSAIRARRLSRTTDGKIEDASRALADKVKLAASCGASAGELDRALEEVLPDAYALVCEACRRTLRLEPNDEQLVAGIAMHRAKLAQMNTGEGKTLAAVFPACLNAFAGRGVHLLTANDYLARRDAEWMGPIYRALGLQVKAITEESTPKERAGAYRADVTYLTARQAGFDYLYDGLAYDPRSIRQRAPFYAIVDEADFLLVDEARIPMVIAAASETARLDPAQIDAAAVQLKPSRDFVIDRAGRMCSLTVAGESKVRNLLGCGGRHEEDSYRYYAAIHVALHARHLLKRDVDYVVTNGKVELVDEFTGRVAERRRWPYGIQTALEAAEGLQAQPEGLVCGRITIQSYLSLYEKIAAMTATALPASEELYRGYGLASVIIPPHRPEVTIHCDDRVFTTRGAKEKAIVEEICRAHATGIPVLVGTRTVEESEALAVKVRAQGIVCEVLNARNDEQEARIIAQAGKKSAVTISTNMAGRGTDIRLGGSNATPGERAAVATLGGLLVIGTSRQESKRIDDQLRGRAGRQGDPGRTQFFVSLEDELMRKYGVTEFMPTQFRRLARGGEIHDRRVAREILRAQRIVEHQHTQMRETLRNYSKLVELQRKQLRRIRRDALVERLLPDAYLSACKNGYRRLSLLVGDSVAEETAVRCLLRAIDSFWSAHLETIEDIREGIHLQRLGGEEPLLVFIKEVSLRFDRGLTEAIAAAANELAHIEPGPDGRLDFHAEALSGPSSTWTYLVNDDPFPRFSLSMIANSNIGVAAAAAVNIVLLWPAVLIAKLIGRHSQKT